jgi:hypothetical protein
MAQDEGRSTIKMAPRSPIAAAQRTRHRACTQVMAIVGGSEPGLHGKDRNCAGAADEDRL